MQTRAADKLNGTLTIWTIVTSRMNAGGITETFTDESRRERPEITEIKAVFEGLINMHCLTTAGEQIYGSPGATYCDRLKFIDAMKSRLNIDSPSDVLVFEPNGYVVDIAIKRYGYQAVHCTEKTFTEAKISKAIERFSPAPLIAIVDIPA